jgi:hypothetical protein
LPSYFSYPSFLSPQLGCGLKVEVVVEVVEVVEEVEVVEAVPAAVPVAAAELPRVASDLPGRRTTVKDRCIFPARSSWTTARNRGQGPKSNWYARAQ